MYLEFTKAFDIQDYIILLSKLDNSGISDFYLVGRNMFILMIRHTLIDDRCSSMLRSWSAVVFNLYQWLCKFEMCF